MSSEDRVSLDSVRSSGIFHTAIDGRGAFGRAERDERFIDPDREYINNTALPTVAGFHVPIPLWRNPSADSIALAADIDQVRWIQVAAYVERGGGVDVPLVDSSGYPLLSPGLPPLIVLRYVDDDTDRVDSPFATNIKWTDKGTNLFRQDAADDSVLLLRSFVNAQVRLKKSPRPHWVLRLTHEWHDDDSSSPGHFATILCHVLSEGSGIPGEPGTTGIPTTPDDADPSPLPLDNGVSGAGHYRVWKPYARHSHLASPDQEGLRRHCWANGEEHINQASSQVLYLNSPSMLSGGTNVFESPTVAADIGPAVDVQGNWQSQTAHSGVQSAFEPSGIGRGREYVPGQIPPHHAFHYELSFYSEMYWDGSDWAVEIFNEDPVPGQGDRDFFIFAFGYRDNV